MTHFFFLFSFFAHMDTHPDWFDTCSTSPFQIEHSESNERTEADERDTAVGNGLHIELSLFDSSLGEPLPQERRGTCFISSIRW
jgi:hypothetical protein